MVHVNPKGPKDFSFGKALPIMKLFSGPKKAN
jgi:hypothetical protein